MASAGDRGRASSVAPLASAFVLTMATVLVSTLGWPAGCVAAGAGTAETRRTTIQVRPGQNLSGIFASQRVPAAELVSLMRSGAEARRLERLRPGQRIDLHRAPDGRLRELALRIAPDQTWRFVRSGNGYEARAETTRLARREAIAEGTIETSLYVAARRAGLSNRVILALARVFEWDVDLSRDLRKGDRFKVVYEELLEGGRRVRDGEVLAAELVTRGRSIRAVRYEDPSGRVGYYAPDGTSLQKAFLRAPIEFARVSSGFSPARRHPILHTVRAHRGVDYAAPSGTPVRATGDGRVTAAGRAGGYGRTVVLAHGGQYTTLYAHLSRFAAGLRVGAAVKQGQVIGYVGHSGLATGPHLHYEFRVRGTHRDPLTVELPSGRPVALQLREDFLDRVGRLCDRLDLVGGSVQLAEASAAGAPGASFDER